MLRSGAIIVVAASLAVPSALAAERLTVDGVALAPAAFAPGQPFAVTVDAGADTVRAAHVVLRPASSSIALARDRDGFWAPWDGDPATLPPAATLRDGPLLTFKLFAAPPAGMLAPFAITIAYRTDAGVKLGWFDAAPLDGAQ